MCYKHPMQKVKRSYLGLGLSLTVDSEGWIKEAKLIKKGPYPNYKKDEFPFSLKKIENLTDFQRSVYKILTKVPAGKTITYQRLGEKAGYEKAGRAVGSAMANNKLVLFIPCHRVVQASGGLGRYSGFGGSKTKGFLLDFESSEKTNNLICGPN